VKPDGVYPLRVTRLPPIMIALLAVFVLPAGLLAGSDKAFAAEVNDPRASIALIIDDLGNQYSQDSEAIKLTGPVTCAFLPYAPFTRVLAEQAHAGRKEVMLHLPMEALNEEPREAGELTLDMTRLQFIQTLQGDLASVPHVSGINNHKGSLLTRHPGHMAWLMQGMSQQGGLFFVDSRTTAATVARQLATEYRIPSIDRRVFLDNQQTTRAIQAQFRRLLDIARRDGTALGIGHPHTETLAVLRQELARLDDYNIQLVPVSRLIEIEHRRKGVWQASLSR
jgi:polysaccharide deacetylase 2 family uncharacterized protein YibQ